MRKCREGRVSHSIYLCVSYFLLTFAHEGRYFEIHYRDGGVVGHWVCLHGIKLHSSPDALSLLCCGGQTQEGAEALQLTARVLMNTQTHMPQVLV